MIAGGGRPAMAQSSTVDPLVVNAVVPLLSVLLGGALTYWLNVRARRRGQVENLFNQAITAVAVADASRHYLSAAFFKKPESMSDAEYRETTVQIERAAIENLAQRAGEAREALGRVLQYEPAVKPHYQTADSVVKHADEIIALLAAARDRVRG